MLSPEQRAHVVRAVQARQSIAAIARELGVRRPAIYEAAERDPEFAKQLAEARASASDGPASGAALTPYDSPDGISREQATAFGKSLHKTLNVQQAAHEAGVDLFPRRVRPCDLTPKQRAAVRNLLDALDEPPPAPPGAAERAAFEKWAQNADWSSADLGLDVDKLRALSARAADSFEKWRAARAQVVARHQAEGRRRRTDDSGWEAF